MHMALYGMGQDEAVATASVIFEVVTSQSMVGEDVSLTYKRDWKLLQVHATDRRHNPQRLMC